MHSLLVFSDRGQFYSCTGTIENTGTRTLGRVV
jgi:hypothetical protein